MTEVRKKTISVNAADGWQLAGDLYSGPNPKIAVLISSGTGFPRRFYRHISNYLAAQGAVVLTYDYRGIGDSVSGSLKGSPITLQDWGRLDMTAAVDALEQAAPGLPITHTAHSVGGHFLGLMPNQKKIQRNAFIAVGSGYFGHHRLRNWPLELYFWWFFGSYSLTRYGFIKSVGGWRGEALPPEVFKTWRRWSHNASYFGSEIQSQMQPQHYDQVTSPIRSWLPSDDPIATPKANAVLMSIYPNAEKSLTIKTPKDIGVKAIGHDGAFRADCTRLWDEVLDWLLKADAPEMTNIHELHKETAAAV